MLTQLKSAPRGPLKEHPIDLLMDCHGRIRWFSGVALRLATETMLDAISIADGAKRVHRYFSIAMPLHVEDEELSLRPRVEKPELQSVLASMGEEHARIEDLLAELLPAWELLGAEPSRLDEQRPFLEPRTRELHGLFEQHLAREEDDLFPVLRKTLPLETLQVLTDEFRARRQPT